MKNCSKREWGFEKERSTVKAEVQGDSHLTGLPCPSGSLLPLREGFEVSYARLTPCYLSQRKKNDCIFAKLLFKWNECFKSSFCVVIGLLPGEKNIQIENRKTDPPLTQSNFL